MDNMDAVIEKIKKCIRLANKAGTEGERAAAEAAARRMADANGINLSEMDGKTGENIGKAVKEESEREYWRTGAEVGFIVNIIRNHFGVVIIQTYPIRSRKMKLIFFGLNLNIEVAKYVYDILQREFHTAWREAKGWGLNKRAFMTGWFQKIDLKLREHPLRNDLDVFQQEKEAAEEKFREFKSGGGVKEKKTSGNNKDAEALYRGYMAADSVSLNRPCDGRASASPFALGHTRQLKGGL